MRHCRSCGFKHKEYCQFWENLRSNVPIVGCSEKFIRQCCEEDIFGYSYESGVFVADSDTFFQKWYEMFAKDKVHAQVAIGKEMV